MLGTEVRRDARLGDADAQFELGCMYHDGYGVHQDYVEAAKWFRRAADQGDEKAQFALGLSYFHGQGVAQDLVTAYMWFDLAARSEAADVPRFLTTWVEFVASGDHEARNMRDHLAEQMTRKQISTAQRAARASLKSFAAVT